MLESNRFAQDGVEQEELLQHTFAGFTDNDSAATPVQSGLSSTPSAGLNEDWLRLAFVALPASRCRMVLERWQDPTALMAAVRRGQEAELLATPGITPPTLDRLKEASTRDLKKAYAAMETYKIRLLREADEEYPVALHGISDPPPYLFIRGTVEAQDEVAVAIVGTRHATEYGRGVATKLAEDLAQRGITVVSGITPFTKPYTIKTYCQSPYQGPQYQ